MLGHSEEEIDIPLNCSVVRWKQEGDHFLRGKDLLRDLDVITILKRIQGGKRIFVCSDNGHVTLCDQDYKIQSSLQLHKPKTLHVTFNKQENMFALVSEADKVRI